MINFFRKKRKILADENLPFRVNKKSKQSLCTFDKIMYCSFRNIIRVAYLNKTINRAFRYEI
jgi:hypothetical protein